MAKKLTEGDIVDFSHRVTTLGLLPNGTEIRFFRKRDGRRVRSDFTITRQHIITSNLPVPGGKESVAAFIERALKLVTTDLKARGIEARLYSPAGELLSGNTHIDSIRALPGLPGEEHDNTGELFGMVIVNAGLGESLTFGDVHALYREMDAMLPGFKGALEKNAARIRGKDQGTTP